MPAPLGLDVLYISREPLLLGSMSSGRERVSSVQKASPRERWTHNFAVTHNAQAVQRQSCLCCTANAVMVGTEQLPGSHMFVAGGASRASSLSVSPKRGRALGMKLRKSARAQREVNPSPLLTPTFGCDGVDSMRASVRPRHWAAWHPQDPQALRAALPASLRGSHSFKDVFNILQ